jgi:hypothetical protein
MSLKRGVTAVLVAILAAACTGTPGSRLAAPESPDTPSTGVPAPAAVAEPTVCPTEAALFSHAVTNRYPPVPGSARWIVPGEPTVVVVCESQQRTEVTGSRLRRIVDLLNGLRRMQPGSYFCAIDVGPHQALFFNYELGAVQLVTMRVGGCSTASNGERTGWLDRPTRRVLEGLPSPQ